MKYIFILSSLFFYQISFAGCHDDLKNLLFQNNIIGTNLANVETTRTPEGGPYKPKEVVFCNNDGCRVLEKNEFTVIHDPKHADADAEGNVSYPKIDIDSELAQMKKLSQQYIDIKAHCRE